MSREKHNKKNGAGTVTSGNKKHPPGWSKESHSNDVDPNYDIVFPSNAVNTITFVIEPDDWAAMQTDIEEIKVQALPIREAILAAGGTQLSIEDRRIIAQQTIAKMASATALAATEETKSSPGPSLVTWPYKGVKIPQFELNMNKREPIWVPATIYFQNREWTHVGIRYKGVSSLSVWVLGESRLPFKLKFDKFEDDYPEIRNQRFFGFQELTLANNYEDDAGMRDTVVYDLLEAAGLPALQTAAYEVFVDYGEGPILLGLYTMVEVVDDTGIPNFFGDGDGNIYEGDGLGASLEPEHADKIVASFQKKNHVKEADWSDIWALYEALHDQIRLNDPPAWRANLEAVFDVDTFLKWLGIRGIVGHSDSYGSSPHNFYLYHNPKTDQLTWFSWDHNLTFKNSTLSYLPLDKPSKAPLISFILDDPVYYTRYKDLLAETFSGVAAPEAVIARVRAYAKVIAPYATKQMSQAKYDEAVQEIIDFINQRAALVTEFLASRE